MPTTEMLRKGIDDGRAGDKVSAPDPAAAPLGTDDEAGGTPNSRERIHIALGNELHAVTATSVPRKNSFWAYVGCIVVLAIVFVWAVAHTAGR